MLKLEPETFNNARVSDEREGVAMGVGAGPGILADSFKTTCVEKITNALGVPRKVISMLFVEEITNSLRKVTVCAVGRKI